MSQEITGSVIVSDDNLRHIMPPDTQAFLRYQSFSSKEVLIIVNAAEAQSWKLGETRICVFTLEEESAGCILLICQPRVKKEKKK